MFTLRHHALGDDRGSITVFMAAIMVSLVMITGLAIEILRQEHERHSLQDALDRGALATASLRNAYIGVEAVDYQYVYDTVQEYVDSRHTLADPNVSLTYDVALTQTSRTVGVTGEFSLGTIFLRGAGLDEIQTTASSTAEELVQDVEISIVMDVSGSMSTTSYDSKSRIQLLREAASGFVDDIYLVDSNDVATQDNVEHISVSLVPFSYGVNVGDIAPFYPDSAFTMSDGHYNYRHSEHSDSTSGFCTSLEADDFLTLDMPTTLTQVWPIDYFNAQNGTRYNDGDADILNSTCADLAASSGNVNEVIISTETIDHPAEYEEDWSDVYWVNRYDNFGCGFGAAIVYSPPLGWRLLL